MPHSAMCSASAWLGLVGSQEWTLDGLLEVIVKNHERTQNGRAAFLECRAFAVGEDNANLLTDGGKGGSREMDLRHQGHSLHVHQSREASRGMPSHPQPLWEDDAG